MRKRLEAGFSAIEILLALFLFCLIFLGISSLILDNLRNGYDNQERVKAEFLAQEGMEVTKAISANTWLDLTAGVHGLALNDNRWQFTGSNENVNSNLKNGTRQINIEPISENLKKITSEVAWLGLANKPQSTVLVTYLANWQRNLGDWQKPIEESYYALLTDARSVFHVGNRTYIGTLNYRESPDFYIFDTSDLSKPKLISTLDLGANTWATVFSIYVVGNYAYLATSINGREFVVVDISDENNPHDVAYQTTQTLTNATGVHVSGDYAYVTNLYKKNQKQLYVFNVKDPTNPDFVSRIDLTDSAYNLTFKDNYVFVASGQDNQELQIINVADPLNPYLYSSLDLSGTNDAYDVYVKDNIIYLVRAKGDTESEFFIIDISDLAQPKVVSSLKLGDNFRTVYYNGQYIMVGGDLSTKQFEIIDVADLANPNIVSSVNINGIVYDLVADAQAAYLAVGGGEGAERGLKIIIPGS